jgi:hypothetical protein
MDEKTNKETKTLTVFFVTLIGSSPRSSSKCQVYVVKVGRPDFHGHFAQLAVHYFSPKRTVIVTLQIVSL